jgi:hypothetical protein
MVGPSTSAIQRISTQLGVDAMHGTVLGSDSGISAAREPTSPISEFGGETVVEVFI